MSKAAPGEREVSTSNADGVLYPSVAVSDAFNTAGFGYAAFVTHGNGRTDGAIGFGLVALAAAVGVLRFGFSERKFAKANGDLADLAAFVGLPLLGRALSLGPTETVAGVGFVVGCTVAATIAMSLPPSLKELATIVFNVGFFIFPAGKAALVDRSAPNLEVLAGLALFVVAGVVIKPERHKFLFGVRRENWFHYMIAMSAVLLATGMD